jgi:hypothetical protein
METIQATFDHLIRENHSGSQYTADWQAAGSGGQNRSKRPKSLEILRAIW